LGSWSNAQPSKLVKEKKLVAVKEAVEVTAKFMENEGVVGGIFVDKITATEFTDIINKGLLLAEGHRENPDYPKDTFGPIYVEGANGYGVTLACGHDIVWHDTVVDGQKGILVSELEIGHSAVILSVLNAIAVENGYSIDWSDLEDDRSKEFRGPSGGILGWLFGEYRTWQDCIFPYQLN
jgi:hypothetical protein